MLCLVATEPKLGRLAQHSKASLLTAGCGEGKCIRLCGNFREELKQRIWGRGLPGKAPQGPAQLHGDVIK